VGALFLAKTRGFSEKKLAFWFMVG
jgi:hypothetical protein